MKIDFQATFCAVENQPSVGKWCLGFRAKKKHCHIPEFAFRSEESVNRFIEALEKERIVTVGEFAASYGSGRRFIKKAYDHSRLLDA